VTAFEQVPVIEFQKGYIAVLQLHERGGRDFHRGGTTGAMERVGEATITGEEKIQSHSMGAFTRTIEWADGNIAKLSTPRKKG